MKRKQDTNEKLTVTSENEKWIKQNLKGKSVLVFSFDTSDMRCSSKLIPVEDFTNEELMEMKENPVLPDNPFEDKLKYLQNSDEFDNMVEKIVNFNSRLKEKKQNSQDEDLLKFVKSEDFNNNAPVALHFALAYGIS